MIYFEMCIFVLWFTCYDWDILVVYFASIVNKSFLKLIYLTCQYFPHGTLMRLVPFREDRLKPSQDSEPSSCSNFQGSNTLDYVYFMYQSIGEIVRVIFSHDFFGGFVMDYQRGRFLGSFSIYWHILWQNALKKYVKFTLQVVSLNTWRLSQETREAQH